MCQTEEIRLFMDKADGICIGLDLGSDTLKIAYAYGEDARYGKFIGDKRSLGVAIPAVAYYDKATGKWLYGDEVDMAGERSLVTVVKIRDLMSLLSEARSAKVREKNTNYYRSGDRFPKFMFPAGRRMSEDFGEAVRRDMTFEAPGHTPESVCEGYFAYVRRLTEANISALQKRGDISKNVKYKVALVYPATADKTYIAEYSRLAEAAFGVPPDKVLSFTKALGMYAYEAGMLSEGESLLIFDMGEETISVAKASLANGMVVVDGTDGHNEPLAVGGRDVDGAIADHIRSLISRREAVGYPSYGDPSHISETWLHSKLYLFMKEIKEAKVVLSAPDGGEGLFADGVPVSVNCDLYIERKLTRADLKKCVGITDGSGVAKRIADYVTEELKRPVNHEVKKVFFSGGLTETYALADYIKACASEKFRGLKFYPVDSDGSEKDDGFTILRNEDSVYAPAVGGAVVSLKNYNVRTVIALSYGTWVTAASRTCLAVFVDRGMPLEDEPRLYLYDNTFTVGGTGIRGEKLFSTVITRKDIEACYFPRLKTTDFFISGTPHLDIGDDGSSERKRIAKAINLVTVAGKGGGGIYCVHRGARVELMSGYSVSCKEGIIVSPEGRARPYISNAEREPGRKVKIRYTEYPEAKGGGKDYFTDLSAWTEVRAGEIEIKFSGIDDVIDVVTG